MKTTAIISAVLFTIPLYFTCLAFSKDCGRALLGPINIHEIADRVGNAKASDAAKLHLPQLAPDVRWVLTRIDAFTEKATQWAHALSSQPDQLKRGMDIHDTTDIENNLEIIETHANLLKKELQSLLEEPEGIPYEKWYFLAKSFTQLASIPLADTYGYLWHLSCLRENTRRMESGIQSNKYSLKESDWKNNEWTLIPTVRALPHPAFNKWQELGLAPVAVIDEYIRYDGDQVRKSPYDYFYHDERHALSYAKKETRLLAMGFIEYQKKVRGAFEALTGDQMLKDTMEGLWHIAYHEDPMTSPPITDYSPLRLLQFLRYDHERNRFYPYRTIAQEFKRRLRPHDLGDFFIETYGAYPQDAMIQEAIQRIGKIALNLLITDVRARIQRGVRNLRFKLENSDLLILDQIAVSLSEDQAIAIQQAIEGIPLTKNRVFSRYLRDVFEDEGIVNLIEALILEFEIEN